MVEMKAVDTGSITATILTELERHSLDPTCIINQCYDGASAVSDSKDGVQSILQSDVGKKITNCVHCLNHQLHLVVVHAMEAIPRIKIFFELCQNLYVFFKLQFASNIYEGQTLKRLLVQR